MKSGKVSNFFSDLLFGIIYFAACNLIFWLLWLIVSFVSSGIYNEIYQRSAYDTKVIMDNARGIVCILLYLAASLFIYKSNPVERNRYITRAYENKPGFLAEYAVYAKERLWKDVISYMVFLLPLLIVGVLCNYDIAFFPTAYIAQYNLAKIVADPVAAYFTNIIVYALAMFIFVPVVRTYWYGKRLR